MALRLMEAASPISSSQEGLQPVYCVHTTHAFESQCVSGTKNAGFGTQQATLARPAAAS